MSPIFIDDNAAAARQGSAGPGTPRSAMESSSPARYSDHVLLTSLRHATNRPPRVRPKLGPPVALVASASPDHSRVTRDSLETLGFRVWTARSISEAEQVAVRVGGPVDLLAVDLEAATHGLEGLVSSLRVSSPALSVLGMSTGPEEEVRFSTLPH